MKIPDFKEKFIERYEKLTNIDQLKEYSTKKIRKSVRVNEIKISVEELKDKFKEYKLEQVPWCKEAFFVSGREDLGNLIWHSLGYFYVQEAASLLPSLVLMPKQDDFVLDMCAAPGSKTTHLANIMKNNGLIIANDSDYKRLKALSINLQRCGVSNTVISLMEGRFFKNFEFDKILVDAPCSATGNIRRSLGTIETWNIKVIKKLAGIQRQLIRTGFENLKEKGVLVYSTCSIDPEENEAIVNYLLENYENAKLEKIDLNIKRSEPILEFDNTKYSEEVKKCLRLWPQDNDTEGFFVARIKKV